MSNNNGNSTLTSILGGLAGAYMAKRADDSRQDRHDSWMKAQYGDKYKPPKRQTSMLDDAGAWIKKKLGSDQPDQQAANTPAPQDAVAQAAPAKDAPAPDAPAPSNDEAVASADMQPAPTEVAQADAMESVPDLATIPPLEFA